VNAFNMETPNPDNMDAGSNQAANHENRLKRTGSFVWTDKSKFNG